MRHPFDHPFFSVCGGLFSGFWGLLVLAMGAYALHVSADHVLLQRRAAQWETVPAQVRKFERREVGHGKKRGFRTSVEYAYTAGGREHTGTHIALGELAATPIGGSDTPHAAQIERAFQERKPLTAHVDPAAPGRACLYLDLTPAAIVLAPLGLVFLLAGLGIASHGGVGAVRAMARHRRAQQHPDRPWRVTGEWDDFTVGSPSWLGWILPVGRLKYGPARLVLPRLPIATGTLFQAELRVDATIHAATMGLELACVRFIPGHKGKQVDSVLHRQTTQVPVPPAGRLGETRVPVQFQLPPGAPGREGMELRSVRWRLTASAETPGLDFSVRFDDLPVFDVPNLALVETNPER